MNRIFFLIFLILSMTANAVNIPISTLPLNTDPTTVQTNDSLVYNKVGTPDATYRLRISGLPTTPAFTTKFNLYSLLNSSPTFTGNVTANSFIGPLTGTASGNTTYTPNIYGVVISGSTNAMTVLAPSSSTAFPLISGGSGASPSWAALGIAGGGTGQTTAVAGFDALSPMSALGDMIYGGSLGTRTRLSGNTTTTKKFFSQTGDGVNSAAPAWATIVGSDLPNPSSSTLGGIQSYAAVSNQWINAISTSGVPSSTQPAFTNISGSVASTQMPALTGDVTTSAGAVATTLATVNSNVGTFGSATKSSVVTVNAKGLVTAASESTVTPAVGSITGFGTGIATWLATPSSANLASAITDETGSGALVFATGSTLSAPYLGTPAQAVLTNATGLPISSGVSGLGTGIATFLATPSSANFASAITDETGTGSVVLATGSTLSSPVFTSPTLGTPLSGTLTNATGLPLTSGVTGVLPLANGGTNSNLTPTAHGVLIAASASSLTTTAAGTSGQVLTSNGSSADPTFQAIPAAVAAWTVQSKSANYTAAINEAVQDDVSSVANTITLPTAVGVGGKLLYIGKADSTSNKVYVATTSSQTIAARASLDVKLAAYGDYIYLFSDGANWQIQGKKETAGGVQAATNLAFSTIGADGNYAALSGNSVTFPAYSQWRIHTTYYISAGTGTSVGLYGESGLYGANGANSASAPTALTTVSTIGATKISDINPNFAMPNASNAQRDIVAVVTGTLAFNTSTTVYCVPRIILATAGSATAGCTIVYEREW